MTIYFNDLGNNGHLGNQMFQIASLMGIASSRGYNWSIPPKFIFGKPYPLISNIYDCFKLPLVKNHIKVNFSAPVVHEKKFNYDQDFIEKLPDEVSISGYFQSERYFRHIEDNVRENFEFKQSVIDRAKNINGYAALHVRRTDYVLNSLNHTNLNVRYYSKALDSVGRNNVFIFSDDIEWCMSQQMFSGCNFSNGDAYTDLYLMSKADSIVLANSSLSWWAAWLGKQDLVVAPREWFGPALLYQDTKDLYLENWKLM